MSNATFAGTHFANSPTKSEKTRQRELQSDTKTTYTSQLNPTASPSTSLSGSQDSQLRCSESMLSLTQSSADSQNISESGSQESLPGMSNPRKDLGGAVSRPFLTKPGEQVPIVSNGHSTVVIQQGQLSVNAATVAHTSIMSSNLSQLAELAASQTPHQMIKYAPSSQANIAPVHAGQRFIVPGQNVPLPLGPQGQLPPGYGPFGASQAIPPGMIPPPFIKGSIIQLTSGELKRVEDLTTEDFVHSTSLCPDLKLETSTVVTVRKNDEVGMALVGFSINSTKAQVTLSCPVEHPFFVYGQGWSSCIPEQSAKKYNLQCHNLKVGDVCIFLSPNLASAVMSIPGLPPGHVVPGNGVIAGSQMLSIPEHGPGSSPGVGGSPIAVKQVQVVPSQSPSSAGQVSAMQVQTPVATPPPPISSAQVTGQPLAGGTFTFIDQAPGQVGFIRSPHLPGQTFINQQVITSDGKTVVAPHGIPVQAPAYYQSVPASFVTPATSQTFVQSSGIHGQTSVGNGLLVTAVGFVPGQHPMQMSQPGLVYAAQLSEMAHKKGQEKVESGEPGTETVEEKMEPGPSDAKRQKIDVNTEGK